MENEIKALSVELSPEQIEKAFNALLRINKRAIEVIKRLDGKTSYFEIGKDLNINRTIVSSIQRESFKLHIAYKINNCYKKKAGILKYAPRVKSRDDSDKNEKSLATMKKRVIRKINITKKSSSINFRTNEAHKMTIPYQWLYITENALRDLIRVVLGDTKTWWKQKCPVDFMQNVSDKMNNSPYNTSSRKDELEYCELDHLKKIISKNWTEFSDKFHVKEKYKFTHQFENALPTRNSIGHCVPLTGLDMDEVAVRFNDILKMIK